MPNKRGTILIETCDVVDGVGKQLWSLFLLPSAYTKTAALGNIPRVYLRSTRLLAVLRHFMFWLVSKRNYGIVP
jgi:hypothetical protein